MRSVVDRNVMQRIPQVCQFLGPFYVAAGSTAIAAIPGCGESGSAR
jgi:hypothetical protein